MNKLNGLVAKLATYGKKPTDEEKMMLITRFLPDSFAPMTITASSLGVSLSQFMAATRAEADRRKSTIPTPTTIPCMVASGSW